MYLTFKGVFIGNSDYLRSTEAIERRIGIKSQNNNKPSFVDCANYSPTIPEEKERGFPVITVHASDDDPPESGGTITYSLIWNQNVRNNFAIHNVTGEIVTNTVFDRDEPARQKELYIIVKATDNGNPILADTCTIRITISDINDNAPNFDKLVNLFYYIPK